MENQGVVIGFDHSDTWGGRTPANDYGVVYTTCEPNIWIAVLQEIGGEFVAQAFAAVAPVSSWDNGSICAIRDGYASTKTERGAVRSVARRLKLSCTPEFSYCVNDLDTKDWNTCWRIIESELEYRAFGGHPMFYTVHVSVMEKREFEKFEDAVEYYYSINLTKLGREKADKRIVPAITDYHGTFRLGVQPIISEKYSTKCDLCTWC